MSRQSAVKIATLYLKTPVGKIAHRATLQNSYARTQGFKGKITAHQIINLWAKQMGLDMTQVNCAICGEFGKFDVDHIVPARNGGTHEITNLQLVCEKCHYAKTWGSRRHPELELFDESTES